MMQPLPRSTLKMIHTYFFFELLVALFNFISLMSQPYDFRGSLVDWET